MRKVSLKAMAKINLGLDVTGTRPDGYHELRMIMQSVKLCDMVSVSVTKAPGVRIRTNLRYLPSDGTNLACRAAALMMKEYGISDGVFINLEKRIPVAAGLAGGSSDAAAVLTAMDLLFDLNLPEKRLRELGVRLGADVPFCVMRGTALAEGVGEILTPLPALPDCFVLIAKPALHISTKTVFSRLQLSGGISHPDIDAQALAVREGDLEQVCSFCGNVLETVTEAQYPVISRIKQMMRQQGALTAMMSGSGPSVFGIFTDEKRAERAKEHLLAGNDAVFAKVTRPYRKTGGA